MDAPDGADTGYGAAVVDASTRCQRRAAREFGPAATRRKASMAQEVQVRGDIERIRGLQTHLGLRLGSRPVPVSSEPIRTALSLSAKAFLGTRLIVWAAGLVALMHVGENVNAPAVLDPSALTAPFHSISLDKLAAPMGRWDSVSYLQVAHAGYQNPLSTAFYPLYPLLIRIGSVVPVPPLIVGGLLSSVAAVAALALLHRLARLDLDARAAALTVLLVACFPTSVFLSATYTESLFLLLTVAAVYAARTERWWLAGLAGGLAAFSRSNGVLILVPLVLLYLYGPRPTLPSRRAGALRPPYRLKRDALWLLVVPLGLLGYMAYLWAAHGTPFQALTAEHKIWYRWFAGPFGALGVAFLHLPHDVSVVLQGRGSIVGTADPLSWNAHELIDFCFALIAIGALVAAWRQVPRAYWLYALVSLAFLFSVPSKLEPLASFSRYMLPLFPLFMGTAAWMTPHRRLTVACLAVSGGLLALFSGLWGLWDWVA